MIPMTSRSDALEQLSTQTFDLLVVGGGIIGARIALEAALAGDRVALVDAGDFGGATSSASSKLIHGGLRYLQMYDFGLVHESHVERAALLSHVAPHLVTRLPFLFPLYRGGPQPPAPILGAGLLLYAALSGFRYSRAQLVRASRAREWVPSLRTEGMRWAGLYEDAQTNDGRLVLATVTAAERAGAIVLNHAAVTAIERGAAQVAGIEVHFRRSVNAAGPWVDGVRRLEDSACSPMAMLSKGVHVTVPLPAGWRAALTVPLERGRVAFAVPWEGTLMLGTTDTAYSDDPSDLKPEPADVETVLREAAIALPPELLRPERILTAFAGLRVLPNVAGDTAGARREHLVQIGPTGMVSVAGGKLTTHRRIAIDVLRRLDPARYRLHDDPLPGAGPLPPAPAGFDPESWKHLTRHYGSEALGVLAAGSGERIHPDGPDVWAQIDHGVRCEWALTVDDLVRRRTTLQVRGLDTAEVRCRVAERLQPIA